jgi:hypothetical protein
MRSRMIVFAATAALFLLPAADALAKTVARYHSDLSAFSLTITKSHGKTKAHLSYVQTVPCRHVDQAPGNEDPADGTFKGDLSVGKHGKLKGTLSGTTDTGATLQAKVHGKAGKNSAALKGKITGSKPSVNGQTPLTCSGTFDGEAERVK